MRSATDRFIELSEELSKELWDFSDRKELFLRWLEVFDDAAIEIRHLQEKVSAWERVVASVCHSAPAQGLGANEWVTLIKGMAETIPAHLVPKSRAESGASLAEKMRGLIAWNPDRKPPAV